jgi:hypothetical protein
LDPEAVPRMRVHPYKKNNKLAYAIDVPVRGEYAFNVYAFKKDEPHNLNNAYAFLINSHGRHIDVGSDLSAFCRNATSESISLGTGIETSVSVVTIDSDLTSFVFFQKFLLFSSGLLFNVPTSICLP